MSGPLNIKNFHTRMTKCAYFKEQNNYVRNASLLFKRVLKKYNEDKETSFIEIFTKTFSRRSFKGINSIYSNDRQEFKTFCIKCADNINKLLNTNSISNINTKYLYRYLITGRIDGILEDRHCIINFSYKNSFDTQKNIDFYVFNNYIYNVINNTTYDTLIMVVPLNSYFIVKFKETDYTIRHGLVKSVINNKMKRCGDYCLHCSNNCKPTFINKLNQMECIK